MFAVIFEVQPKPEAWDTYLGLAKLLKPELEQIDGFLANERFASQQVAGRILSLSIWRDEKALIRWRTHALHHDVQVRGRNEVFADYHLRVGEITADSHLPADQELRQERFDTTHVGAAKVITIAEAPPGTDLGSSLTTDIDGLLALESYEGITVPGKPLLLASWRVEAALSAWLADHPATDAAVRDRAVRIIRDYGMQDRVEAPQYYPPVANPV